jgi:GntR family transcriptional regulator
MMYQHSHIIGLEAALLQLGPIPLYHQLHQDLAERIDRGEFPIGQALPTEEQLGASYGVSRNTVRRALDCLRQERRIARRRGLGTFLVHGPQPLKSVLLVGSLDDVVGDTKNLSHKVVSRTTIPSSELVREVLGLEPGARVVRIQSITYSTSEPFAYVEFFFPEALGAMIHEQDITDDVPVLRSVERTLRVRITSAMQTVHAARADRAAAAHLGIKRNTPVLNIIRTYYADGERPVEAAIAQYHPDRYRYTVQLFPRA